MRYPLILLALFSLCLFSRTHAYYIASGFPKPAVPQYTTFYKKNAQGLLNISTGVCNASLHDYHAAFTAPADSTLAHQLLAICYTHEKCILDNLTADIMANLNSAIVILGLMPTLLSTIGPSVADISLLSAHRPLLAFLISLGAPAVWPTRLFEHSDPVRVLGSSAGSSTRGILLVVHVSARWAWMARPLSAVQYLLAAGAAANVVTTSVELGRNSILSWGCTTTFGPLLWTTLASVVHVVAAVSFALAQRSAARQRSDGVGRGLVQQRSDNSNAARGGPKLFARWLWGTVQREVTLCAEQEVEEYDVDAKVPFFAVLGNVIAGCLGFVHIIFGIIIFSSLQLVSVWDVMNFILWRYVISTVVCRLILVVEIGGLRRSNGTEKSS
ncbi:uncharacterized protein BDZ99DRAFT_467066 [Mytilinidion resinicola]|uniref:Transmembrane protein n=1 Tax=Mytilinidion resinicola TaxID=574789 RepID=A0A6A6YAG3_9PEZI|nr:uncharacterized protein BDZ99DRAFT_467066 [Mytilinidion resinicola]KAF2804817.1 hypothetical protein BDZ99DRAFT_467066 [Mytilinidion resinicola]